MDSIAKDMNQEGKIIQEKILLDIIKEVCADSKSKLSPKVIDKVNKMIADCDLMHYSSLHKLNTADESTTSVLGITSPTATELTFEEQAELNQAIINKIPTYRTELEKVKHYDSQSRSHQIRVLQNSVNDKLNVLREQDDEKLELMMEWLNHRIHDVYTFNTDSTELLTLKTKMLEFKSKILHLQVLSNMYSETDQSIKAYSEIQKDLENSIVKTEQKIRNYKDIIAKYNLGQ